MIKVNTSGNYIVIGYKEENLQLCAFFLHYALGFTHLVALPIAIPPIFRRSYPNLVHLGDGIICYVAIVELTDKTLFQIFFATFKVSKPNRKYIFWKENLWVDYDFISFSIKFFYRIVDDLDFKKKPILWKNRKLLNIHHHWSPCFSCFYLQLKLKQPQHGRELHWFISFVILKLQ